MTKRAQSIRRSIGLVALLVSLFPEVQFTGHAQNTGVLWQAPINLSNTPTSSIFPSIVADKYGFVHVFWAEDLGGKAVDSLAPESRSNSILYSYWDGNSWSNPIDIFYSTTGAAYNYPYATIDNADILHLVWQSYQGINYSSVPLNEAKRVKAWQPAQLIANVRGDGPRIYASHHWGLQVIFPAWENAEGSIHDGNIYFISSQNSGKTWSRPIRLSRLSGNESDNASHPSLREDKQGIIHALWFESEPPDWRGTVVYYSRSVDGGVSWDNPVEIGRRTGDERWASMPEIIILNEQEIHITWVCGVNAHRCHRLSTDGGLHWTNTNRVFGEMVSLAGWDSLVIDGSGQLYWIMQLRYPEALYYSYWTGSQWSALRIVNDGLLAGGHYLSAAIHNGNQLDLIMVQQDEKEIWIINGVTGAASIKPEQQSNTKTELLAAITPTEESLGNHRKGNPANNHELLTQANGNVLDLDDNTGGLILTISILPVIALFLVTILIKKAIQSRKTG